MAVPPTSSVAWFVSFMRLNDEGVIPTVTPSEYMPSRPQLLEFMGHKHNSGYVFDSHGSPEYGEYVRELFVRVEQMHWPMNNVLPFHFLRGLLSEAMGTLVNWAEFAFKQTRPHQSRTRIPRVHEDFAELQAPLPPLIKVLPPNISTDIRAPIPMERYFNRATFVIAQTRNLTAPAFANAAVVENAVESSTPRSAVAAPPRFKYGMRSDVPVNLQLGEPSVRKPDEIGNPRPVSSDIGLETILPGLCALRPGIILLIEAEQKRILETQQLASEKVSKVKERLPEETERVQQIGTIVEDRMTTHNRAVEEYERARRVLVTAMKDVGNSAFVDGKLPTINCVRNCEALVNSWYENVRIARSRLEEWELKSECHCALVGRLKGELNQAENEYRQTCQALDIESAHLLAVTNMLEAEMS